jgi:ubiquitin carboxyl-terminal hydrolase 5/13
MSSILQTIFAFPAFQSRYGHLGDHAETCTIALPADCVECQMRKIADGLLSGRYARISHQSESGDQTATVVSQTGIRPVAFKTLLGRGHPEFSTMKQQDAEEFLIHLLDMLRREERKMSGQAVELGALLACFLSPGAGRTKVACVICKGSAGLEPTRLFTFGMEERLECGRCNRVRYRIDKMDVVSIPVPAQRKAAGNQDSAGRRDDWEPVRFEDCLASLTVPEALEYDCPSCSERVFAKK